jgi:hypothetical protein
MPGAGAFGTPVARVDRFDGGRDVEYDPKNPHARPARGPSASTPGSATSATSPSPYARESAVDVRRGHLARMQQRSRSHYATQQARRRQARETEVWRDNQDRNDDPIYHRTFDDGSMHLKSSKFRDGKPVDNHGKAIGGYGRGGPRQYKRTAMRSTAEGETATFVPIGETNDALRYWAASNIKDHERGWSGLKGAPPWDNTTYKTVPYTLRGLKISSNEAWVGEVGHNPETNFATSGLSKLDDGSRNSVVELFNRRKEEDEAIAGNRGLIPWHFSTRLWKWPSAPRSPPPRADYDIEYEEVHDVRNAREHEHGDGGYQA